MIDLLITAGTVLTIDERDTVLSPGAVAIDGGRVIDVGSPTELARRHSARTVLDRPGSVLMPGWVNTHTHLAMHVFRGLADDVSLEQFLDRLVRTELRILNESMVRVGALAGIAAAISSGVTTALDMYWFPRVTRAVARDVGFRLQNGPTFLSDTDAEGRDFDAVIADAEKQLREIREEDPDEALWVMPHSAYSLNSGQLTRIARLAVEHGARIHTHASESLGELDAVRRLHRERPVAVLDRHGLVGTTTVLAHAVELTGDEIDLLAQRGSVLAHCPVSNLKLGCGAAPVKALIDAGVPVTIGTDGAASGGSLDMFENVRLAALLANGLSGDPTALTARTVVRMATRGGADALGNQQIGSIVPGNFADLQVVDIATLHSSPADAYSAIVYSASGTDVTDVVINGRLALHDRKLVTIDLDQVHADLAAVVRALHEAARDVEPALPDRPETGGTR